MNDDHYALQFLQETMRNLPEENQLGFVLERLAAETDASVLLYDDRGALLQAIGEAPANLIWEIAESAEPDSVGVMGRWAVRTRRSGPSGGVFTVALATRQRDSVDAPDATLDAADVAVTAVLGIMRGTDVRRIRENAQLLETLEQGIPQSREHRYWPRLVELGFTAYTSFLVVVDESVEEHAPKGDFVPQRLDAAAAGRIPLLIANRLIAAANDAVVHMLLPDTAEAREWLARQSSGRAVGISLPHASLTEVPLALRQAEYAQHVALANSQARLELTQAPGDIIAIVDYHDMRIGTWAAAASPPGEFRARKRRLLAPFDDHPDLLLTVVTLLSHNFNVNETARELFIHPNTVRYRLGRAGELLNGSVFSPFVIRDLTIALDSELQARARPAEGE